MVALHPDYPYSYAPGTITGTAESGRSFTVETYDGCQSLLPREELYRLSQSKHQSDVEGITERERKWVGQAVIARQDKDGLYYPGQFDPDCSCLICGVFPFCVSHSLHQASSRSSFLKPIAFSFAGLMAPHNLR